MLAPEKLFKKKNTLSQPGANLILFMNLREVMGSGDKYFHRHILKPLENSLPLRAIDALSYLYPQGTNVYCCGLQEKGY